MTLDDTIPIPSDSDAFETDWVELDNNDPAYPDVDEYINGELSTGDVVYIRDGTHVCAELTPGFTTFVIVWEGTVQPDGDHPVFTTGDGAIRHHIYPIGDGPHIDTTNQGTYTSDAFVQHCKLLTDYPLKIEATGRRAVSATQATSSSNLNRSNAEFWLSGNDSCEVGYFLDNETANANDINQQQIKVVNATDFTAYGAYVNAGFDNSFYIGSGRSDVGVALYSGGGPRGSGSAEGDNTTELYIENYSDGSNTNVDEIGSGVRGIGFGSWTGPPTSGDQFTLWSGGTLSARKGGHGLGLVQANTAANDSTESVRSELRTGNHTYEERLIGNGVFQRGASDVLPNEVVPKRASDPSKSEMARGSWAIYISDGSTGVTGSDDDVIMAVRDDGGTVKTKVLFDWSAN